MRKAFAALAALALIAACSGGGNKKDDDDKSASSGDKPSVKVVDSGFGQSDQYVQAIVVVTTDTEASIGEFATASVNFLDANGEILGTETQVESFSWVNQQLVLPVWLDLSDNPKADVAKIDVSASISDHGSAQEVQPELKPIVATKVAPGEYGGMTATFEFTNTTETDMKSPRIGVVCYDNVKKIIGGASDYPDLVAAGKTVRIDADVTTSGTPASCTAFPNYESS